ncbi:hypothetical protein FBU59_002359, partial [Linderina macrospora]
MVKREAGGRVAKPTKKTQAKAAVKTAVAKANPPAEKSKAADDIDDIFSSKPTAAPVAAEPAQPTEPIPAPAAKDKKKKKKVVEVVDASATAKPVVPQQKKPADADGLFGDSRGANSKYTDDGMRVFYMDDLRI